MWRIGLSRKEQPADEKMTFVEFFPSIYWKMKRQARDWEAIAACYFWGVADFSPTLVWKRVLLWALPELEYAIRGIYTRMDSLKSQCVFVLKTIDLLLKRESVSMLPFVPSSRYVRAIVSSTCFDTKWSALLSVMHISASIYRANSYASSRILSPLFKKLKSYTLRFLPFT